MAEIKNYMEERNKRSRTGKLSATSAPKEDEYMRRKKIRFYGILTILLVLLATVIFGLLYFQGKTFTGYEVINTVERKHADGSHDVRLGNSILTYSQDGAHCLDSKGTLAWNQSYEIQDLKLAICRDMSAICGYNGHNIYVQSAEKQLGEVSTNLPIKNVTVAETGRITVVLEDTDVIWMNTYDPDGKNVYEGQFHMSQSGYPAAVSLSPGGDLLATSFIFVDQGSVVSNVVFYNYGPVGDNQSDQMVSAFSYRDVLVPEIHFMNSGTAFAVGDNRLMIYTGEQVPTIKAEYLLDREILGVYYSEKYVGLVFGSDRAEAKYMLRIFDANGQEVTTHYFDMEYLGLFFEDNCFVMYNATDCMIYTMGGKCRYEGRFDKSITLMVPTETPFRYRIVTDNHVETIQLH